MTVTCQLASQAVTFLSRDPATGTKISGRRESRRPQLCRAGHVEGVGQSRCPARFLLRRDALVSDARRQGAGDAPLLGLVGRGHEFDLRARQPELLGYIAPAGRRALHLADDDMAARDGQEL